jgi:flagellar biosynthesis chaperone FliJ
MGVQKPKSPTSVVKGPDSLADDYFGQRSTSDRESRRQSRLPSSSQDESKFSEMDSSQTSPSLSITMRPSSFSQIPISSDMTPEEWNIAQQQIQFLENELDKVTALCLELTQSVEEEEKVDTDRPSGDWLRAQQQVRYLAQELDTVSGLCDMLTKAALESTDAIEMLEEEKAKLESLIKRLEKALNEKEAMMKDKDIVEENESTCCGYCCNWIPEPIVWFISYIYRLD